MAGVLVAGVPVVAAVVAAIKAVVVVPSRLLAVEVVAAAGAPLGAASPPEAVVAPTVGLRGARGTMATLVTGLRPMAGR